MSSRSQIMPNDDGYGTIGDYSVTNSLNSSCVPFVSCESCGGHHLYLKTSVVTYLCHVAADTSHSKRPRCRYLLLPTQTCAEKNTMLIHSISK